MLRVLRRRTVVVHDHGVILPQLGMGRVTVMHVSHPRFGNRGAEGEEQEGDDEPAEEQVATLETREPKPRDSER